MQIRFPSYSIQVEKRAGKDMVFDAWRRKWVRLQPEEWVRQHVLHHLVEHCAYPSNRLAVEHGLTLHGMPRRADIVVFDPSVQPWLVVECKAPEVALRQAVLDQAAHYNIVLRAPFLAVCNGVELLLASVDLASGRAEFLDDWPVWPAS